MKEDSAVSAQHFTYLLDDKTQAILKWPAFDLDKELPWQGRTENRDELNMGRTEKERNKHGTNWKQGRTDVLPYLRI